MLHTRLRPMHVVWQCSRCTSKRPTIRYVALTGAIQHTQGRVTAGFGESEDLFDARRPSRSEEQGEIQIHTNADTTTSNNQRSTITDRGTPRAQLQRSDNLHQETSCPKLRRGGNLHHIPTKQNTNKEGQGQATRHWSKRSEAFSTTTTSNPPPIKELPSNRSEHNPNTTQTTSSTTLRTALRTDQRHCSTRCPHQIQTRGDAPMARGR